LRATRPARRPERRPVRVGGRPTWLKRHGEALYSNLQSDFLLRKGKISSDGRCRSSTFDLFDLFDLLTHWFVGFVVWFVVCFDRFALS